MTGRHVLSSPQRTEAPERDSDPALFIDLRIVKSGPPLTQIWGNAKGAFRPAGGLSRRYRYLWKQASR